MLNLSRRAGQSLKIGDDIEITILHIDRNQVRIGINAPKEIPILRDDAIVKKEKTV